MPSKEISEISPALILVKNAAKTDLHKTIRHKIKPIILYSIKLAMLNAMIKYINWKKKLTYVFLTKLFCKKMFFFDIL